MKLYYMKDELPEVTGLSLSTIEEEIRHDRFPKPRQTAIGELGWSAEDLRAWADGRPVVELPAVRLSTELYRHFDRDGVLLYVGISISSIARLAQHMNSSGWASQIETIIIERFPTRAEAEDAERAAIKAEKPLHNIVHAEKANAESC